MAGHAHAHARWCNGCLCEPTGRRTGSTLLQHCSNRRRGLAEEVLLGHRRAAEPAASRQRHPEAIVVGHRWATGRRRGGAAGRRALRALSRSRRRVGWDVGSFVEHRGSRLEWLRVCLGRPRLQRQRLRVWQQRRVRCQPTFSTRECSDGYSQELQRCQGLRLHYPPRHLAGHLVRSGESLRRTQDIRPSRDQHVLRTAPCPRWQTTGAELAPRRRYSRLCSSGRSQCRRQCRQCCCSQWLHRLWQPRCLRCLWRLPRCRHVRWQRTRLAWLHWQRSRSSAVHTWEGLRGNASHAR
mmetsp:Transcript_115678/g.289077  ORF Transcript_115678/g.289077 Transcript_115678/m.289077 type:complete len:296 (-) Transcript_115678:341-1228(-)